MKKITERVAAGLLAGTMIVSGAATVFAGGDTMTPRPGEQGYLGDNQPAYHGHNAYDVLNWSPETDEYAQFMRAQVPLQERNEAYNATQANPVLDQKVQSLSLMGDYGNEFFNPHQYNDLFAEYLFNFWQYQDIQASWHGTVTNPTPDALFKADAPWWERAYEFGIINIPNPAHTNAAHKNGVKTLGCIFFPRAQHTDDFVWQDENGRFPMADKLVEMAKWYGFDGYFINAEERLSPELMPIYEEFVRSMTEQGLYIQVYASNPYGQNNQGSWGGINYYDKNAATFSNWVKGPDDETIAANSLYMNPGPDKGMVAGSVEIMKSLGLDAKETVFHTLEAGQTGFSGVRGSLNNVLDENLVPQTGIANLGACSVWTGLDDNLFGHAGDNSYETDFRRGSAEYQKYVFARERAFWTGSEGPYYSHESSYLMDGISFLNKPTGQYTDEEMESLLDAIVNAEYNPYKTANDPTRGESDGVSPSHGEFQSWPGMAAFISERSVINGSNFYTSFNTGHGMQYFMDGKVANDNEWSNINDQDILPTWQWWTETESGERSALNVDFDYGEKFNAAFDNIQLGGYNGSSSLAIFGDVNEKTTLHLYKTDLEVKESTTLELTYNKPSKTDASELNLVLYLKDGENGVKQVNVPVKNANKKTNGWTKTTLDLSDLAGETIAAFGFSVDAKVGTIRDYQLNLGEITIDDGIVAAPAAPTGLKIDRAFATGEVYLSWDIADYDEVREYNVWAVDAAGNKTHIGATYDSVFYVKNTIYNADETVAFELVAEGVDGERSQAASVAYNANGVSGLTTEAVDGAVNVSWTGKAPENTASIRADLVLPDNHYGNTNTYTAFFAADAENGTVEIPVNDGSRYYVRVSYLDAEGNVLACQDVDGMLIDDHCENYVGGFVQIENVRNGEYTTGNWRLVHPEVYDWWHIWVKDAEGNIIKDGKYRGQESLVIRAAGDYVEVQLEDFNGNKSEWIKVFREDESGIAAAKADALAQLDAIDLTGLNAHQAALAEAAIATAKEAVEAAESAKEVAAILADTLGDINDIRTMRCSVEEFSDVNAADYYHENLDLLLNKGIINGYPDGTFRPAVKVSRGELVTILYRVAGEPAVYGDVSFSDVGDEFYTQAILWAAQNGITTGYPDGTFRPADKVTRQELVTFLYRFANAGAVEEDHISNFPDAGHVADYAEEAMNWAIANGIVNGAEENGKVWLAPEANARRDETTAIVARYIAE